MTVLIDNDFASDVSAWTVSSGSLSHVASEGSDFDSGYASMAASSVIYQTFSAVSSGTMRLDFWWKDAGTSTGATHRTLIYLLPNSTVTSGNSAATVVLSRDNTAGATSGEYNLQYRNGGSFVASINLRREAWAKISIVLNVTARTYDLYINEVMFHRGIASPNASYTSVDRVALASEASADATHLDNVVVESAWASGETTLIEHDFVGGSGEIEESVPSTDSRSTAPQKWVKAIGTYGSFTLGANGAAPDAGSICFALQRCLKDGIIECEFKSSVAGVIYFGMFFRFWDYPSSTGAGAGLFRIYGGGTNTYLLQLPNKDGALQSVVSAPFTPIANTTYTLKLEMRGRVLIGSIKAAAMDSGSYTTLFTHTVISSATGGRGMLSEEFCGPFVATTLGATDNYVRKFRFTGAVRSTELNVTVGENEYSIDLANIKSLINTSSGGGNQNIFNSKGIQSSHRSRADGDAAGRQRTLFNLTHCKVYEQRVCQMTEYEFVGEARPFVTLLRRGPWIADHTKTFGVISFPEFWTPDWDLHGRYFTSAYQYAINTGASVVGTNTSAHDWAVDDGAEALPIAFQKVTDFASGDELRITQVIDSASTNTDALTGSVVTKWEQTGDPNSLAWAVDPADLTALTEYTVCRGFLIQRGSALGISSDVIEDFRDDVKTPATITYTTGSVKTNAAGDYNTNGFNERHGWYEVNAASDEIDISLAHSGVDRHYPVFRLWGLDATSKDVTIGGSLGTSGTDYVLEDMGDGNALLQILSSRTADTTIAVAATSGGSFNPAWARNSNVLIGM